MFILYTWGTKAYWEQRHYSLDQLDAILKQYGRQDLEYIIQLEPAKYNVNCIQCRGRHIVREVIDLDNPNSFTVTVTL